ncbi:hypothetical protein [Streptomyces sp. SID3343]|uniref:hypothetical protein n=1 Tax=Streptomyces sp. SID3343 TaxID=2690260 RepID=UPI00136E6E33|nr:hypothetical protein [Streptomyces sp. SID3343]MYW01351.1 hypothetical protein [Streptomyces sp. SID3343]
MNDDNKNHEILNDRLRGLATATEPATAVPRPDDVRARGIRRRNRIRVGGTATMAACVIAVSAWVALPGGDESTGAAASSGATAGPLDANNPVATASNGPTMPKNGPAMGGVDYSFLPAVPGVAWAKEPGSIHDDPPYLPTEFALYGSCSKESLVPNWSGFNDRRVTPAGSRLRTAVTSTYGSALSPAQRDQFSIDMVAAWSARADACMTRQPSSGNDTTVWSWQADGKRGELVITRRGHYVALVATDMVAADPDYPLATGIGSTLLDHTDIRP